MNSDNIMEPNRVIELIKFLLLLGVVSFGLAGSLYLAYFAIDKGFQGRLGLKVKDWIEVDFQGNPTHSLPLTADQFKTEQDQP